MARRTIRNILLGTALAGMPIAASAQTEPSDTLLLRGVAAPETTVLPVPTLTPEPYTFGWRRPLPMPLEAPLTVNPAYMGYSGYELPDYVVIGGATQEFPGLMQKHIGGVGIHGSVGNLSLVLQGGAVKYGMFNGVTTTWYVGGQMTYAFDPVWSMTVYGTYVTGKRFLGAAAYPYVDTTRWGGFVTYTPSERFSLDVGANTYYDTFSRRFRTDPIVRPTLKVGKVKIGLDLGPAMKKGLERMLRIGRSNNPTIAPPVP